MKRDYQWELSVVPERLQLQVREVTPVVRQDRQFAIRDALLESFPSDSEFAPAPTRHPRGNA
jgi:hypothetical protein